MIAAILSGSRKYAPFGLSGGEKALTGRTTVVRKSKEIEILNSTDQLEMQPGDTIIIETPGGGGFGKKIN
jgi:N-methylhydantoinase B/oxoprolinase/acetone carboxylase alpha subunit